MIRTIQLDETIAVQRPLREVFAYISEFSRIEEWDPAVARGVRSTEGPLGVGSQFLIDMKAGFSLRYSGVECEPERRLLMTVDSKLFTAREEIFFKRIHVDDLQSKKGTYSGSVAYARAKRGLMILTEEWARRCAKDGIVVNAMHPGSADTIVWLAAATEAGKVSGEFWLDRRPHAKHVLPGTRETPAERRELLKALAAFA